ncbi:unnamed protein product [Rotaria socialis]|uniref:Uncharacterized protein n=1 Tax=Rotaria socialis TaxID=392032 RepID=A0A817X3H2_9BILA|nr:unnamed protein product [Rotaria socialis]CAF4773133.1 unnamed protein product [Rotaria socialis]
MNILTDCNVIWLDDKNIDCEDLGINIQYYVNFSLYTFTELHVCSSFILHCTSEVRLLLIVIRDHYVDELLKRTIIRLSSQITAFIYILGDKWFFRWQADTRVRGIFHIDEKQRIIDTLRDDLERYFNQRWSFGVCVFSDDTPQSALDQLNNENAQFMWFQLLIQVLLRMPSTARSKDDMLQQSFLLYKNNSSIRNKIHEFNRTYQAKDAIDWYTKNTFLFRLLNQACRTDDIDLLFSFRFFIRDLHHQIKEVYYEQRSKRNPQQTIIVYRGTVISKEELQILQSPTIKKKIVWFKTFMSTSLDEKAAEIFVVKLRTDDQVSVLEEIHIDDKKDMSSVPFVFISKSMGPACENEVLLSIGSVFELESIKESDEHVWEMKLHLVDYEDRVRSELRAYLEYNIEEETSLITLSNFLLWQGDFKKSEKYNKILLTELSSNNFILPIVNNNLGYTYNKMGNFKDALYFLNISVDLYLKPNACDHIINFNRNLACAYNNKGLVHRNLGEFDDAVKYINKSLALRLDNDTLPDEERKRLAIDRSYCHENIGLLYGDMCQYKLAMHHLEETLDIRKNNLPTNHQMMAQIYNNLSRIYNILGNPSKSFECIEQALTLQIQSLSENHPHRGTMYNTLGEAYYRQGQYSMALLNYEKALNIYQQAPTRNSLLETIARSNIGTAMKAKGDFDGALQAFLDAFSILENAQPRHPNVACALNNIGFAYRGKGDIPTAIAYYKRALDFCKLYLTENNEVTAITYLTLASELIDNQYDLAMEYFQRVISIYDHIGLPHHQNIIKCHTFRGQLYRKQNDHQSALVCYQKAIFHCENAALPQQHILWIFAYTNLAHEFYLMTQYNRALEEYEHALQHINEDASEIPRIYNAMDTCRSQLIELDVRQTLILMLDDVERLL